MTMDLRRLRYFVEVAKAEGFRQAARALGMTQPPLSKQIMALEAELEQTLFVRHARRVELTDAGKALLAEAEPLIAQVEAIPDRLLRAARGETGSLCLGFTPALAHHPTIAEVLRRFHADVPDAGLIIREEDTDRLCQHVVDGHVQAAFIRTPVAGNDELRLSTVEKERLLVAVPIAHPLADRASLALAELADQPFVMFDRHAAPGLYDQIVTACLDAGFSMRIIYHAPQKVSAMLLAASGIGITIIPEALRGIHADALRLIPLAGPQPTAEIALVTRRSERSALPNRFRRFCEDRRPDAA